MAWWLFREIRSLVTIRDATYHQTEMDAIMIVTKANGIELAWDEFGDAAHQDPFIDLRVGDSNGPVEQTVLRGARHKGLIELFA